MRYLLRSWPEIAAYIGVDARTAQRYEKCAELPVLRKGGGTKPRVYAFKDELDGWLQARSESLPLGQATISEQILDRIGGLATGILYRENFTMRFTLNPRGTGVQARIEIEYDLRNSSAERRPYRQEITVDDCECGYVELLSVAVDRSPIYSLTRPAITEKLRGYAAFRGQPLIIEPSASGRRYTGRAVWVVNRAESDFWYLHMGIPTLGVEAQIGAPSEFGITPSFSSRHLYLVGEHVDVTWERHPRR